MSSSSPRLSTWLDTIQNSIGQALPDVTVIVLAGTVTGLEEVDTDSQPGSPLASIYSDPYGENLIDQESAPLNTSAGDGTFQFWALPGYYVIQAFGPGISGQLIYGINIGGSGTSGGPNFSDNETPSGTIDGANVDFLLANTPNPQASLLLVHGGSAGGIVLQQGVDYTLAARDITLVNPPASGDTLFAFYRF